MKMPQLRLQFVTLVSAPCKAGASKLVADITTQMCCLAEAFSLHAMQHRAYDNGFWRFFEKVYKGLAPAWSKGCDGAAWPVQLPRKLGPTSVQRGQAIGQTFSLVLSGLVGAYSV